METLGGHTLSWDFAASSRVLAGAELFYNCGFCKPELISFFPQAASSPYLMLQLHPSMNLWGLRVWSKTESSKRTTRDLSSPNSSCTSLNPRVEEEPGLQKAKLPEKLAGKMEELSKAVENIEFEQVEEILKNF